jgi:MEKHLA domain
MLRILSALFLSLPIVNSLAELYKPIYCGPSPIWYSDIMVTHASHLLRTYFEVTGGKELVPMKVLEKDPTEAAKLLFFLPKRVVVSHGTQNDDEGPVLNYGNSAALKRWGASWEELTSMPSKYTAEAVEQSAREEFLQKVYANGVVENYSGVRIGLDKSRYLDNLQDTFKQIITPNTVLYLDKLQTCSHLSYSFDTIRFRILDGTVWNLKIAGSESSDMIGQAATFSEWEIL